MANSYGQWGNQQGELTVAGLSFHYLFFPWKMATNEIKKSHHRSREKHTHDFQTYQNSVELSIFSCTWKMHSKLFCRVTSKSVYREMQKTLKQKQRENG